MHPRDKTQEQEAVLLVDDEDHILASSRLSLRASGVPHVITLQDSREVMPFLAGQRVAAIVLDLHMPHLSGQELLSTIVRDYPGIPVILMTANDDIQTVISCMKSGAFDYLVKPVESSQLVGRVKKALEMRELSSELKLLKQRLLTDNLENPEAFAAIVTVNKAMRALFQYVEVIARTSQPIMITGETGVGKELFAKAIHSLSGRSGAYVAVNVAGLDDNMFSDTLFGHRKGAFTGADHHREGLIEKASKGTLFLDEIGDLNETSQVKLLRLLQEQEYYPVGSDLLKKSDARIVLATNRNIQEMIKQGTFRNDLYYRLFAHRIHIPPLRERPDDIPLLLDHLLATAAKNLGLKKPTPPPELAVMLGLYAFPGNVRELEALAFDAVARHTSGVMSMDSFRAEVGEVQPGPKVRPGMSLDLSTALVDYFGHFPTLNEVEDYLIDETMKMAKGNQGIAAQLMGMGRQTLNKRLKKARQEG
ncbi:MAG: sigma-54-dependent transcriptional regulator [Desulfuromonadales bacterium]